MVEQNRVLQPAEVSSVARDLVANVERVIVACQQAVRAVSVNSEVCNYVLGLVRATREHPALRLGASPRGSLGLFRLGQAMAAVHGEHAVWTERVKALAEVVLAHRLIVKEDRRDRYHDGRDVIRELVEGRAEAGLASNVCG
jgi:MoxR-like ATPase